MGWESRQKNRFDWLGGTGDSRFSRTIPSLGHACHPWPNKTITFQSSSAERFPPEKALDASQGFPQSQFSVYPNGVIVVNV